MNNVEIKNIHPYYLLSDNETYKLLVLHILKTLNNDIKETIFDLLIYDEELTLEIEKLETAIEEVKQSINQYEIYLSDLLEQQYEIYLANLLEHDID